MLIIDILIDEQEMQKIDFISNKILLEDKRINTWDDYKTSSQQQLENRNPRKNTIYTAQSTQSVR